MMKRLFLGVLTLFLCAACGYSHDAASYFPSDWRADLVQVEGCRQTAHPRGGYMEVWVSTDLHAAAEAGEPTPVGAVIMKIQWDSDESCTPGEQNIFTVMRKHEAGTATELGDWDWQTVGGKGGVVESAEAGCAGCHAGCTGHLCTEF